MSGNYAPAVSIADAIKYKNHTDDCIKEVDAAIVRFMTMQRQLIAQKDYIEACTTSALGDTVVTVSGKIVDYRVKLYKHRDFIGKSVEGTWVSAGFAHSLFVNNLGNVYSFGDNSEYQLGRTTDSDYDGTPTLLSNIGHVIAISASNYHSLVLDVYGNVFSFGDNYYGQLGHGDNTKCLVPTKIENIIGDKKIIAISGGPNHSLVLDNAGNVYSFGRNANGELGHGDITNLLFPKKIESTFGHLKIIAISAGHTHNLVLDDAGNVYSWGYNGTGGLGHGDTDHLLFPKKIESTFGHLKIIAISAGSFHSLVLDNAGKVYSFGRNDMGQLGQGDTDTRRVPTKIPGLTNIRAISAGGYHSLVLDNARNVYSFGLGEKGQLGHGNTTNRLGPTPITAISNATAISAGFEHSLVVNKDNRVYSFGKNDRGQAGVGTSAKYSPGIISNDTTAPPSSRGTERFSSPPVVKSEGGYNIPIFNSSQILPGFTNSVNDPERIALTTSDKEVFNGVDIIGTKQFLIGVNAILTHPNNISETLVPGTYPYSAGAKHALSTGVLKGLLMQGNEDIPPAASYNTIVNAIPDNGTDSNNKDHFEVIRGFGLN